MERIVIILMQKHNSSKYEMMRGETLFFSLITFPFKKVDIPVSISVTPVSLFL